MLRQLSIRYLHFNKRLISLHSHYLLSYTIQYYPNFATRRCLITESHEPWLLDSYGNPVLEKVYNVVLVEQHLPYLLNYSSRKPLPSWKDYFSHYFPPRGVQFKYAAISTPTESHNLMNVPEKTSLFSHVMESLTHDLIQIEGSIPMSTILVARGPIMSLVAQYYLESWPLAGLVMIDPLLLPPPLLTETASILLHCIPKDIYIHPTAEWQTTLLQQLRDGHYNRELKLEPGSIPMCILSSSVSKTLSSDETSMHNNNQQENILSNVYYTSKQTVTRHNTESLGCTAILHEIRYDISEVPHDPYPDDDMTEMLDTIYSFCENKI